MSKHFAKFLNGKLLNSICCTSNWVQKKQLSRSNNIVHGDLHSQPKIIIVGAGISGLSAANHLIQHGFRNVTILEASERFGGRVWSRPFKDCICELGAKYINFSDAPDSLYRLAKKTGLLKSTNEEIEKYYMTSKGEVINQNIVQGAQLAFSGIIADVTKAHPEQIGNSKNYLQESSRDIIKKMFKDQAPIAQKVFDSLYKDLACFIGCDLSMMNATNLSKIAKCYSNPIYISNGLTSLCQQIARPIRTTQLHYGKPVSSIRWGTLQDHESAVVESLDGSKYLADHVICTLPLGTLKMFSSHLFQPQLPEMKTEAINRLGVGYPGKIFFAYPDKINSWFMGSIKPLWPLNKLTYRSSWIYDVTEISLVPESTTVLEIKVGGASNEETERQHDAIIVDKITKLLRTFFQNGDIKFPTQMLRSFWSIDGKFLGGQSFLSTYSGDLDIKELSKPIYNLSASTHPVLLFAGEATSLEDFGTLEGARRSGIREAQRIIDFHLYNFDQDME